MSRSVRVYLGNGIQAVGTIHYDSQGAKESAVFEYDPSWLRSSACFAIEPSLPLGAGQRHL